jgi:ABC-2 type transport system ATP-binding protein
MVADGTAESLRKRTKGYDILRVRIEDGDSNQIFKALQSVRSVKMVDFVDRSMNRFEIQSSENEVKREIFKLCVSNNWVLTELTPFETKLEDIFRDLTMN